MHGIIQVLARAFCVIFNITGIALGSHSLAGYRNLDLEIKSIITRFGPNPLLGGLRSIPLM